MGDPEPRDEAGRKVSDHRTTTDYVFHVLVPQLEREAAAAPEPESVALIRPPIPEPRKLRIGEVVYDVFPDADE